MRNKRLIMLLVLVLAVSLLVGCDLLWGIIDPDGPNGEGNSNGEGDSNGEGEITDALEYWRGTWQITKQTVGGVEETIDTEVNRVFLQFTDDRIFFIVEDGDNHFVTGEYAHYWDEEAEKRQIVMGFPFYVEWNVDEGELTWDMKIYDRSEEVYINVVWEAEKASDDIMFAENDLLPKPEMILPGDEDCPIEGVWRLTYQEEYDTVADFNDGIYAEVEMFPEYLEEGFRYYYMVFDEEKAGQITKVIKWNGEIDGEIDENSWDLDYEVEGDLIHFSYEGTYQYSSKYRLNEFTKTLELVSDLTEAGYPVYYNIYVKVEDEAVAEYLP